MKKLIKVISLLVVVMMLFATVATMASADPAASGTITIQNAAKGETYKIYKLFDASVTGKDGGSIVYTGTIPDSLNSYFEIDNGYVKAKNNELSTEAIDALKAWADSQTNATAQGTGDGGALVFSNVAFGYYVVTSTQNNGAAITVTSTNPNAVINDKNVETPGVVKNVNDANVYIGQTVTYTVTAVTTTFLGEGANNKRVVKYEISDTLPDFLSNVTVTRIAVDSDGNLETTNDQTNLTVQQFTEKKITISWVDDNGKSLYNNGAQIIVTYTAVVTGSAVVDGNGNTNTVTLTPYVEGTQNPDNPEDPVTPTPWSQTWSDSETIKTYAAALKKVDENNQPLAGAKFATNGLTVNGSKGNYKVTNYDSASTALGTVMETDDEGNLVILGLPSDITLTVTETEAPAGYNKLSSTFTLQAKVINEAVTATSKTVYYDESGNVSQTETSASKQIVNYNNNLQTQAQTVTNTKGTILPETGGEGTVLFLTLGSLVAVAAAVVLVARKKTAGYR